MSILEFCRTSTLPALFVFGKAEIDVKDCVECLYRCMSSGKKPVLVWVENRLEIFCVYYFVNDVSYALML